MGLLSNPKSRKKIVDAVSKYNNFLCVVSYIVGIVWFLALAYKPLNAKTYFSENALLPGVVDSRFYFDLDVEATLAEVKEELKKDKRNVPRDWVYEKFREIGLDTYRQNYTVKYPLQIVRGQLVPGQNVYGILRARRSARAEAVVLSVPMRAKSSDMPQTYGGLVAMLGLARFFIRQPYWSKDIIFLATDHEQIGMQAWLDGYHHVDTEYIRPGELQGRSGQIQAALNLEIPDNKIGYMNIKIEGLNGQLPNLDLVNLVVRLCHKHGVEVMLHDIRGVGDWEQETLTGYQQSLKTMVEMMWAQATGLPSGNHGLFHRYHIEALTLQAVRKKNARLTLDDAGRVVEGIFRSLNNLLERFHQSFFFYILPGTERYVSIGLYMIPFAIMCASCLIKAIALWVNLASEAESASSDKQTAADKKTNSSRKKLDKTSLQDLVDEEPDMDMDDEENAPRGVLTILPILLSSVIMSIMSYIGPDLLSSMAVPFKMNIEDAVFFGFLALFTASLMFPRMVARRSSEDKRLLFDWQLLKAAMLIFQALMLFGLSLMNISLAFFLAVIFVPVSVIVHPSKNRLSRWGQKLLVLLISPLTIVFSAALITSLETTQYTGILELLGHTWSIMSRGVLLSMVDKYFFGSWLFTLFSFAILPNWLTLWGITFCEAV